MAHVTPSLRPSAKPFADGGGLFFVAGLVEQCKHIAFVVLDTGLIERIDSENVSRDTARLLKKVKQLADVVLVDGGNGYANIWHTTIYMGKSRAGLGHLIDLVDMQVCYVIKPVKVSLLARYGEATLHLLDRYDRLENSALAVLYPLPHRMEVGGIVNRCGEYAAVLLALTLAVQLLPPFGQIVQTRVVVDQYLNFLPARYRALRVAAYVPAIFVALIFMVLFCILRAPSTRLRMSVRPQL